MRASSPHEPGKVQLERLRARAGDIAQALHWDVVLGRLEQRLAQLAAGAAPAAVRDVVLA